MDGGKTEKCGVLKKLARLVEWVVGLVVMALVIFTLFLFLGAESADFPIPDDSDLLVVLPEIADEDNAFIAIMASTNLIVMGTNSLGSFDMSYVEQYVNPRAHGCDPETIRAAPGAAEKADKILADNAAFFEAFSKGLERKGFRNVGSKTVIVKGYGFVVPPVEAYRWVNHLWQLKVQREIERGEWDKAQESLETLYRFGRARSDNALSTLELICGVFGGFGKMIDIAASGGLDDAALARLAALACDDRNRYYANVERILKLDYSAYSANLDTLTPEMVAGISEHTKDINRKLAEAVVFALGGGVVEAEQSLHERIANGFVRTVLLWPGYFRYKFHRRTTIARIAETTRLAIKGEVDVAAKEGGSPGVLARNGFGREILALYARECETLVNSDTSALWRGQALLAIATARWRLVQGEAMPPSLEALVPQFLDAVPVDPYSKDGSPFQYDPKTGVAWSVGDRKRPFDYMEVKDKAETLEAIAKRGYYSWAFRIDGKHAP